MPVISGIDLSESELSEFREVFNLVDRDGSGYIDAGEVRELMTLLGMTPTMSEVQALVQEIDTDGNGVVDFEEFLLVMAGGDKKGTCSKRELLGAFKLFADKTLPSGFITPEALETALLAYGVDSVTGEKLVPEGVASLVAQLETDLNGNINYLEKVNTLVSSSAAKNTEHGGGAV
eukprot:CAMPEP_0197580892 /NCGR_PEP_ID=MMETSP1326-20131121/4578_1 /TAXON_ID=1155430 /ORGANISM="Genus nov. species nov., Strain RCC2288" /LENGTH=175 /DNA_ID=CAMNT_0043144719 /DNA_START=132 /DNA_END=660 /DNA_ORIENTATION=-